MLITALTFIQKGICRRRGIPKPMLIVIVVKCLTKGRFSIVASHNELCIDLSGGSLVVSDSSVEGPEIYCQYP